MKTYYEKNGLYFVAMTPAFYQRRKDLTPEAVSRRERSARFFRPGWDEQLTALGLIVRINHNQETELWMVESEAIALLLGCKPKTVEKNLEVTRYMRYIPLSLQYVPEAYGYTRYRTRKPVTRELILGVEMDVVVPEEEESPDFDLLDMPDYYYGFDDSFELPDIRDDTEWIY